MKKLCLSSSANLASDIPNYGMPVEKCKALLCASAGLIARQRFSFWSLRLLVSVCLLFVEQLA